MCIYIYIYGKFLASHHNGKQSEGNFLALRAVYPAPLTVLVLGRTLLWLLLLSTHRHLLWERCIHEFGTEGMLSLLSPCASVICVMVAKMEIIWTLPVPPSMRVHREVHEQPHPWCSAVQLRGGCSSHVLRNSLPSEHTPPKTLWAATSHGQRSWACVCPWLSPG